MNNEVCRVYRPLFFINIVHNVHSALHFTIICLRVSVY